MPSDWLLSILLIVVTFAVYRPAWDGAAVFDDHDHLIPPELQSIGGLGRIWCEVGVVSQYYPVFHSAMWLQCKLWGHDMLGYHLVNIGLHAFSALLLFRVIHRLAIPGAWLAAGIFAMHPVMVESVAWISELKNTLSAAFYLGASLAYLNFDRTRARSSYAAAFVFFVAGLLSKSVVASLPAALLVVFWWKRGTLSWKSDARPLLPFFAASLAMAALTAWVEKEFIGATGDVYSLDMVERCLVAGRALWFYASKLLWPADLVFIYPRWAPDAAHWWQWLFPCAILLLGAVLWGLRKRGRAPLAAALLFGGTLFPALGFIDVYPFRYSFVADHYVYLATFAPIALAGAWLGRARKRFTETLAAQFLSIGLLLGLGTRTWSQSRIYRDSETLWNATLAGNPRCALAHSNLGLLRLEAGRFEEAEAECRAALAIDPRFSEAHVNLGNALRGMGRSTDAERYFRTALELRPDFPAAHYNLGVIHLERGRLDDALACLRQVVSTRPRFADGRKAFGFALLQTGNVDEAIIHLQAALQSSPGDGEALTNLGNALFQKGDVPTALLKYQEALVFRPTSVELRCNLARALFKSAQTEEGISQLREAVRLRPDLGDVRDSLVAALLRNGREAEAAAEYADGLKRNRQDDRAALALAWLLATSPDSAVRDGAQALNLAEIVSRGPQGRSPLVLRALAAAVAESGRFSEAAELAEEALMLSESAGAANLARALKTELEFYQTGRPWRR